MSTAGHSLQQIFCFCALLLTVECMFGDKLVLIICKLVLVCPKGGSNVRGIRSYGKSPLGYPYAIEAYVYTTPTQEAYVYTTPTQEAQGYEKRQRLC